MPTILSNTKQPVQPHHMLEDCKQGGALTLHVKTMPAEFEHVWQDTDVVGKNGAELKILRKAIDVKVLQMYEVHVENLSLQECLFDALKEVTKVNMHNAVVIAKAEQLSNTCKQLSKNAESNEVQAAKLAHRNKVFKDIANLIATLEEA